MIALTPIERKAAFMAAVTLRRSTQTKAAGEIGVSLQHLQCVLDGSRPGSRDLKRRVALYIGLPAEQLFPELAA